MIFENIKVSDYDYNLPSEKIAKYPTGKRDSSKLLIYNKGNIKETQFVNIPELFTNDDFLVFNETKVIKARLFFKKPTGAKIEVFCLEPSSPSDYELAFQAGSRCEWKCTVGNLKKWKKGQIVSEQKIGDKTITLFAEKVRKEENAQYVRFIWNDKNISFGDILEKTGKTPIPPYLNRHSEESDTKRYQTVYSKNKGSVAAPTAGLHFTPEIINELTKKGTGTAFVNLHVGAGTFKPVKSDTAKGHTMHSELISVPKETIEQIIANIGKITAVGTTSVRTLESLYWTGIKIISGETDNLLYLNQNEAAELTQDIPPKNSLNAIVEYMTTNNLSRFEMSTQIFIVPGYKFKIISRLITNFHMPKSTLLMLIGAFIGDDWKKVYDYALNNDFRFLSYGDSSILMA